MKALALIFALSSCHAAAQAIMIPLGDLSGGGFGSVAGALSGDGQVATGTSTDGGGLLDFNAFRWTQAEGMTSLARPVGRTYANGLSTDGSYIVGAIEGTGVGRYRGAYWSPTGEFHIIGDLPGGTDYSILGDVSDNGVAVGASSYADGQFGPVYQAIRWTVDGGLEPLGFLPGDDYSFAVDISADGSVIGGRGNTANWFWTEGVGIVEAAPAGFEMRSMTSDGLFMLGRQNVVVNQSNQLHAVLWSESTGTVELDRSGFSNGAILSNAIDATANAEIVVGLISGLTLQNTPYIWFEQGTRGMTIAEYLLENNLDFSASGYRMTDISAISDDGTRFLVQTFNPDGKTEAVLIIVPSPSTALLSFAGLLALRRRR